MRPGKKGASDGEALGRSRGGFSTKIHIVVDALGNPVEFILTAGQEADVTQAEPLIEGHEAEAFILDKAYDSDAVVAAAKRQGAEAVIPPKKNRKVPRDYDKHLYKETQEGRVVHQPDQAVPAGGDPVREDGPQLPWICSCGVDHGAVAVAQSTHLAQDIVYTA